MQTHHASSLRCCAEAGTSYGFIRRNTRRASGVKMAAMRATKRLKSRSLRLMALAVGALFVTMPLLGLNCEVACARGVNRAATVDGDRTPAGHCDSHRGASPAGRSGDSSNPDRCGHHTESVLVKPVADDAASGSRTSILNGLLQVRTVYAFDRSGASAVPPEAVPSPRPGAARPSILRL